MTEPDAARTGPTPAATAWQVISGAGRASLATVMRAPEDAGPAAGTPYASLVLPAALDDGTPFLLLSDLSDHAQNLHADPRGSLLYDGTSGHTDPLTGPRVSLVGRFETRADETLRAAFVARYPGAEIYAGFADFHPWVMTVEHAHLVAGFGRIHWIAGNDLMNAFPGMPA